MTPDHHSPRRSDSSFHRRRPARARYATQLRHELDRWARARGLPDSLREALTLAGYEALANAVTHAYPPATTGSLEMVADDRARTVTVTVIDHGQWRTPPAVPGPTRGRGLPLIRALADRARIDPHEYGTTVTMSWPLP
jgi:serine/threonine-protein kinase RsbW